MRSLTESATWDQGATSLPLSISSSKRLTSMVWMKTPSTPTSRWVQLCFFWKYEGTSESSKFKGDGIGIFHSIFIYIYIYLFHCSWTFWCEWLIKKVLILNSYCRSTYSRTRIEGRIRKASLVKQLLICQFLYIFENPQLLLAYLLNNFVIIEQTSNVRFRGIIFFISLNNVHLHLIRLLSLSL